MRTYRILLSGVTGFIGGHLAPLLLRQGHDLHCIKRYVAGRHNYETVGKEVWCNLLDLPRLRKVVTEIDPEIFIHCGAFAPVGLSYYVPLEVWATNYKSTVTIVDVLNKKCNGFKQMLFAGTSEEYGTQTMFPIEEDAHLNPATPYATSKAEADIFLMGAHDKYGFPVTIMRPFNCYDVETEVLTSNGWKYFRDLNDGEHVATLNPQTNMLEFQKPTEYFDVPFDGKMVRVSGSQIDLLVTPNHRMWLKRRWKTSYEILEAEHLLDWAGKRAFQFQLSADHSPIPLSGNRWMNPDWIMFLAWWLSEGCLDRRPHKETVDIRQCNLDILNEIEGIASRLGYRAKKYWYHNHDGRVRIYGDTDLYRYLIQFGKSHSKFIPREIFQLPRPLIRLFIDTYQRGDGSIGASRSGYIVRDCIISSSNHMLDDLQELVLRAGWASTRNGRFLTIARTRTEVCPRSDDNFTVEPYRGRVYCVSVPNELLYVRRRGRGIFCGNTYGRIRDNHYVIERIITQMLSGSKQISLGDPTPERDFMFRDDHVHAYIAALGKKKAIGQRFNFCTGTATRIDRLVEIIGEEVGWRGDVIWNTIPPRPGDAPKLLGSYEKAQRLLSWAPTTNLREGLRRTISELREAGYGRKNNGCQAPTVVAHLSEDMHK